MLDLTAGLLLAAGATLFVYARFSLSRLANGSYDLPAGVTWVSRAELHDLQSKAGLWTAAAGLLFSLAAFVRHALHRAAPPRERVVNW